MKTLKLLFMSSFIMLLLTNCEGLNGPAEMSNSYMPFKIGSYWIYETNSIDDKNEINKQTRDSMVVTDIHNKGNYKLAAFQYFTDGVLTAVFSMNIDNQNISLKSKVLYPFLPLDSTSGWSQSPDTEKAFVKFELDNHKNIDTSKGDIYPYLIDDGLGGYTEAWAKTIHIWDYEIKKIGDFDVFIGTNKVSGPKYNIDLTHYYASTVALEFQGISFINCVFLDDNQKLIANTAWLEIMFGDGVGIVETKGEIYACDKFILSQSRKLIDYKLNK